MHKRKSMRTRALAIAAASACFGLMSSGAYAQAQAYTSQPVDLFAGPSGDYPVVTEIGPNVPVTVMGCVSDYSWCDVALPDLRGWIYADYLAYPYQGGYVPIEGYGATIGLPIVTFALGAYWDSFYRGRPWYGDRDRWAHRPEPRFGERPSGPPPMRGGMPPEHGGPPPGMGRPPAPSAGVPRGEPPHMAAPQVQGGRPAMPAPMNNAPRQPGPTPQYGGHPPAPPAAAYGHAPYGQPGGQQRAPGPGAERPQAAPQGGHPSGEGSGGRNENRQQY